MKKYIPVIPPSWKTSILIFISLKYQKNDVFLPSQNQQSYFTYSCTDWILNVGFVNVRPDFEKLKIKII